MEYEVYLFKQAIKDKEKIMQVKVLKAKVQKLIEVIKVNPYQNPPAYEKLNGKMQDLYSRRINGKHRLVYKVDEENKRVMILSMWTHYENI